MRTYRITNAGSSTQSNRRPTGALVHCVYWKDLYDKGKGCAWILIKDSLEIVSGAKSDDDVPFISLGLDYTLAKARGKKWQAFYSDGAAHEFKASPSITKRILISIIDRWSNPPLKLKAANGAIFKVADLREDISSCVYLVELHAFEPTSTGSKYYKIGKAKSIPRRIKQFGPCTLIASISAETESRSLKIEAELHKRFDGLRRNGTEIFSLSHAHLQEVLEAFNEYNFD